MVGVEGDGVFSIVLVGYDKVRVELVMIVLNSMVPGTVDPARL